MAFTLTAYSGNNNLLIATQGGSEAGMAVGGSGINANFKYIGQVLSGFLSCGISGGINYTGTGNLLLGSGTTVGNAYYCVAEGQNNSIYGLASHVEGNANTTSGTFSHVEGASNNVASVATGTHIEGLNNFASGSYCHIEGFNNSGLQLYCHVEGVSNIVTGINILPGSHAEGVLNVISGAQYSHAEGTTNLITGSYSHAEGSTNKITTSYCHAEGFNNIISGQFGHAEGQGNTINNGANNHVEGGSNAIGPVATCCHVEGYGNTVLTSQSSVHMEGAGGIGWAQGQNISANGYLYSQGDSQRTQITTNSYTTGLSGQYVAFYYPTPGFSFITTSTGYNQQLFPLGGTIVPLNIARTFFAEIDILATNSGINGNELTTSWKLLTTFSINVATSSLVFKSIKDVFNNTYAVGTNITGSINDDTGGKRWIQFNTQNNGTTPFLSAMSRESGTGVYWTSWIKMLELGY